VHLCTRARVRVYPDKASKWTGLFQSFFLLGTQASAVDPRPSQLLRLDRVVSRVVGWVPITGD
jgi:hypothetical protein